MTPSGLGIMVCSLFGPNTQHRIRRTERLYSFPIRNPFAILTHVFRKVSRARMAFRSRQVTGFPKAASASGGLAS